MKRQYRFVLTAEETRIALEHFIRKTRPQMWPIKKGGSYIGQAQFTSDQTIFDIKVVDTQND
jgi:hypothetical protein